MKVNTSKIRKKVIDLPNKTKEILANTKEKFDKKKEQLDSKTFITQEDMLKILDGLYTKALNGLGQTSPAVEELANSYLSKEKNPEKATKKMINNQIKKCATSGFLTGFGGLITLPITVPANISSVLYVQMRMIACIAHMAGYDLNSDQVQTLVYACLAGVSVNKFIKQTGVKLGKKMATNAIKKIPGKTLTKINQKVGGRLFTKFGEKGVINLGKFVPGVGALIGGSLDYIETKIIAKRAYEWFFEGNLDEDIN